MYFVFKQYGRNGLQYKVLPQDILWADISTHNEEMFERNKMSIYIETKVRSLSMQTVYHDPIYQNKEPENEQVTSLYFRLKKEDLKDAVRVLKAIYHLAKLSGASEAPKKVIKIPFNL